MALTATVVIATRDRPGDLRTCLSSLERQDADVSFDVVIVDDGSVTPLVAPVDGPMSVRVVRTGGLGPGQARNVGVRATSSDVILFTDDDVVVEPSWVTRAMTFLEGHPDHGGVEGIVRSLPWDPLYEGSIATSEPGHHWTCNVAYRRSRFEAVGGFAPGFPAAHCEDRDLGLRIAADTPIGFDPLLVVTHSPRALGLRQMIRRARLVASDIELERRHPQVFPRGRLGGRTSTMAPLRLAYNWIRHATPGSPYRVDSPSRAARFMVLATGQVLVAAWVTWGRRWAGAPPAGAELSARGVAG